MATYPTRRSGVFASEELTPSSNLLPSQLEGARSNLKKGQYELDGFVFGTRTPWLVPNDFLVGEFGIEEGELSSNDVSMPNEDGTMFGIDTYGGMNLIFKVMLWRKGQPALDDLNAFQKVWKNKALRQTPGEVSTLKIAKQDRVSIVYGRPRKFLPQYGMVEHGWCPIDMDFKCVDSVFYDNIQRSIKMQLVNPPTSGMKMPFHTPLRVSSQSPAAGAFTVGGTEWTWPTFVIGGPIINPTLEIKGPVSYKISLTTAINHDQKITIDPRPWQRTVLLNRATNRSGRLTADSATMPEMRLAPGSYSVSFNGLDQSLTSYIQLGWRDAYSTP